jgi:hypothetical protein
MAAIALEKPNTFVNIDGGCVGNIVTNTPGKYNSKKNSVNLARSIIDEL